MLFVFLKSKESKINKSLKTVQTPQYLENSNIRVSSKCESIQEGFQDKTRKAVK